MTQVLTNRHHREPEFSCKSLDWLIGKACETNDKEFILHVDRVRKINVELREWGRKEAKELDGIIEAAHNAEDASDLIMWIIEKYPKA